MATGNFEMYLERYAAEYQSRQALGTLRRAHLMALGLKLALGAVAAALMLIMAPVLARQFRTPELAMLMPLLTFMVAFDGLSTTGRAALYGMQRFRSVSVVAIAFHVIKTVMVGALWFTRQGLPALAIGLALLTVAQGVVSTALPLWILRRASDAAPESEVAGARGLLSSMLRYCTPLLGARVTFLSGQNLGKVVLGKLFDSAQLGYFSFAFQTMERFVEVVHTLPSSLLPSLTHLVARGERDRLRHVFDQSFRLIQITGCMLSVGVFVFAREITLLVGSPLFEPAVPLLRIMALVPIARTAQQPLTMLFQALRRPGTVFALALVKFVAEFSCYFTLVPALGMLGAGWANLVGAVASYLVAMALLTRAMPEDVAERRGVVVRALLLSVSLLVLGWALDRGAPFGWSFVARLALIPVAIAALFMLELVRRYDLEKLAALQLRSAWMRGPRDGFLAAASWLERSLAPRRAL